LETASRNLPEYGERYAEKVVNGTGETLLCTPRWGVKRKPISTCERVDGREGVGGVYSTVEHKDNTTLWREGTLLCSWVERR